MPLYRLIGETAMRGFGKRFGVLTACLLACLLTVTAWAAPAEDCGGSCAHQAAIDTTHYDTLEEAVAAAEADATVTLLTDVSSAAPILLEKSLILDLNENVLTGNLTFTGGGSIRGGKLLAAEGVALEVRNCTVILEKDAVLEGCGTAPVLVIVADQAQKARAEVSGILTGKGDAPVIQAVSEEGSCELSILKKAKLTAKENPAIAFDAEGKLDISGGRIKGDKDLVALQINKDRKTEISITGGKLLSKEGEALVIRKEKGAKVPRDFVTGGTYRKVPTAYVPDWCVIRDNEDGTYTVISSYKLTFRPGEGSGQMKAVSVRCGSRYTLPKSGFTAPEDKDFAGWQIDGKTYQPGETITPTEDLSVTALWKDHVHTGGKATCVSRAVCTGCGKAYGKLGSHSLSPNGGYAAACDQPGMLAHSKCSACGGYFVNGVEVSASSLAVAAPGHTWETVEGKEATCTEEGLLSHRKCSTCNLIQVDGKDTAESQLVIPAAGHTLEHVDATESACTIPGTKAHEHCTACDGLFLGSEPVQASELTTALASHVLSDWESDATYHWKSCVSCSEVYRQSRHADTDADGKCDDCGYAVTASQDPATQEESSGFSWLFLIPMAAAVVAAVPLILKKRK